jgi:hypothetical protein
MEPIDNGENLTGNDVPVMSSTQPTPGKHFGVIAELLNYGLIDEEYQGKHKKVHKLVYIIQVAEKTEPPADSDWVPRHKVIWRWINFSFGDNSHFPPFWKELTGEDANADDCRPADLVGKNVLITVAEKPSGKGVKITQVSLDPGDSHTLTDYKCYADTKKEQAARAAAAAPDQTANDGIEDNDIPF